jgi:IS30 family transposase
MGDLSNFERGQIVGVHLAGSSVSKTATLLGVLRATVSKAMSAYMNHGKTMLRCTNDVTTIKLDMRQLETQT